MSTQGISPEPVAPQAETLARIVLSNAVWAVGFGFVPIPWFDFAAVTAINIKMIRELSEHFEVEFHEEFARSAFTAMLGGAAVPAIATWSPLRHALLAVPVVGQILYLSTGPVAAGAITYAVGQVFVRHFSSGGTLLDFSAERFREFFAEQLRRGKATVEESAADFETAVPRSPEDGPTPPDETSPRPPASLLSGWASMREHVSAWRGIKHEEHSVKSR